MGRSGVCGCVGRSGVWEGVRCGKEWGVWVCGGVGRSGVWEGMRCGKE